MYSSVRFWSTGGSVSVMECVMGAGQTSLPQVHGDQKRQGGVPALHQWVSMFPYEAVAAAETALGQSHMRL